LVTGGDVAAALVYGVIQGAMYGAVALGLSLIWGVMKVINLAHGEFVVLGAYLLIVASRLAGVDPLLGPFVGLAVGLLLGLAVYAVILHRLIGRVEVITLKEEMATLLAMFGLSIFLYKLYFIAADRGWLIKLFDTVPQAGLYARLGRLELLGVSVEAVKVYVLLLSAVMAVAMHLFLSRTRYGLSIRAVAQDATALALSGVDPVRVKALATALGIGLAVMGGGLVALYQSTGINPDLAHTYAPLSFAIVVMGGPGNLWGTMAAGVVMGLVMSFVYAFTGSLDLGVAAAFILLVASLVLRPEGLFSRR